jgi:hypothetical protein
VTINVGYMIQADVAGSGDVAGQGTNEFLWE